MASLWSRPRDRVLVLSSRRGRGAERRPLAVSRSSLPLSPGNHMGGRSRKPAGPAPGGTRAGPRLCEMEVSRMVPSLVRSCGRLWDGSGYEPASACPSGSPVGVTQPCPVFPAQGHVRWGAEGDGAGGGPDPWRVLQRHVPDPALHLHVRAGAQPEQRPGDTGRRLPASGEAPA